MQSKRKIQAALALSAMALYSLGGLSPADAQDAGGATKAFAVTASVFGTEVIPPTPLSENGGNPEDDQTLIGIPGDPLVVNGTLIAKTYQGPGIGSELHQPSSQHDLPGPYGARAIGQIEDLSVLIEGTVPSGKLISADLIRAEAVATCKGDGTVDSYSASSEVVDLQIAGEDPLSGPLNDALKQITEGLAPLADVVSVKLNVVNETTDGVSVDAVVVTVLGAAAANGAPGTLVDLVLGHAEISGDVCGDPLPNTVECSDGVDNADSEDTLADADDPGCITPDGVYDPNDDDERNECNDEIDNDGDVLADGLDPGCIHNGVWDPADDDERDALASTGMSIPAGVAAGLGLGALGLLALRRRVLV